MKTYLILFLALALALLLGGCTGFCKNKDTMIAGFGVAQRGYDAYVQASKTDDKNVILADQILAITAPYVVGAAQGACPPDAVAQVVQDKAGQLSPPPAPANPTPAPSP